MTRSRHPRPHAIAPDTAPRRPIDSATATIVIATEIAVTAIAIAIATSAEMGRAIRAAIGRAPKERRAVPKAQDNRTVAPRRATRDLVRRRHPAVRRHAPNRRPPQHRVQIVPPGPKANVPINPIVMARNVRTAATGQTGENVAGAIADAAAGARDAAITRLEATTPAAVTAAVAVTTEMEMAATAAPSAETMAPPLPRRAAVRASLRAAAVRKRLRRLGAKPGPPGHPSAPERRG